MAETSSCPSVGIDLLSRGTLMLEWLEYMFDTPSHKDVLRSPTVLRKAIFRYILFLHKRWLLRDDDKKRFALLPPPDVSWIWHGHMIRTLLYRRDLKSSIFSCEDVKEVLKFSEDPWEPCPFAPIGEHAKHKHSRTETAKRKAEVATKIWNETIIEKGLKVDGYEIMEEEWEWVPSADLVALKISLQKRGDGLLPVWNDRWFEVSDLDMANDTGVITIWRDSSKEDLRGKYEYKTTDVSIQESSGEVSVSCSPLSPESKREKLIMRHKGDDSIMNVAIVASLRGSIQEALPKWELKVQYLIEDTNWLPDLRKHYPRVEQDRENFLKESYEGYLRWWEKAHAGKMKGTEGPTLERDLFWHAHIAAPATYAKDCDAAFGKVIWHQPQADLGDVDQDEGDRVKAKRESLEDCKEERSVKCRKKRPMKDKPRKKDGDKSTSGIPLKHQFTRCKRRPEKEVEEVEELKRPEKPERKTPLEEDLLPTPATEEEESKLTGSSRKKTRCMKAKPAQLPRRCSQQRTSRDEMIVPEPSFREPPVRCAQVMYVPPEWKEKVLLDNVELSFENYCEDLEISNMEPICQDESKDHGSGSTPAPQVSKVPQISPEPPRRCAQVYRPHEGSQRILPKNRNESVEDAKDE